MTNGKFIYLLAATIFIGGCSNISNTEIKPQSYQNVEEPEKVENLENNDTIHKIGETIRNSDCSITITNLEVWSGDGNNTPSEGNIFMILDATIENHSDSSIFVSSSQDFQIQDDQGFAHTFYYGTDSTKKVEQQLLSDTKVKLQSIFEVPMNSRSYTILYSPTNSMNTKPLKFIYERINQPLLSKVRYHLIKKSNKEEIDAFTIDFSDMKSEYILRDGYVIQVNEFYPEFELDDAGIPSSKSNDIISPAFVFKILSEESPEGEPYLAFVRRVDSENFREDEVNSKSNYLIKILTIDDVEFN